MRDFVVTSYGCSCQGKIRKRNDDVWTQLPEKNFFVLADGMGGAAAGDVAAKKTVEVLCHLIEKDPLFSDPKVGVEEMVEALSQAIQKANLSVYEKAHADAALNGMGTTVCCLYFWKEHLIYGHVGDSRIYRLRQQKLEQLTQDDSLLSELMQVGILDENGAADFPLKHVLTKSIGSQPKIEPAAAATSLQSGDLFLTCSDGLTNFLSHQTIESVLNETAEIKPAAEELLSQAQQAGSLDDMTVILVKVK